MFSDLSIKSLVWNTVFFILFAVGMLIIPTREIDNPLLWIIANIFIVVILAFHIGELLFRLKTYYNGKNKSS